MNNTTNTILKATSIVATLTMMTPTIVNIDSTDFLKQLSNYIQYKPDYENLTITVEKMDDTKSNYEKAIELFDGNMRDFTEEEALIYEKSLDKLYEPIGVNIFDLC